MAKFEITAPDGKKYRVSGENAEGAHAALMKHLSLGNSPTGVPEGEGFGEVDMGVPSPQDALTAAMGGQPGIPLPPASEEDSGFLPAVVPPVATVPTATRLDPGAQPIDGAPIIDPLMEAMTAGTPAASTFTRPRPNPRLGAGPAAPAVPEVAVFGMDLATEPRVVAITKKLADPNITPETRAVLEGRLRAILGDRPEEGAMPVPVSDTLQPIVPPDYQPAPDEFEGEGALSLLKRRGQQFVKGAANIFAGVPEGLAIRAAAADRRDILSAGHMEAQAGRFGQEIAAVEGRMAEIEATLGLNGKPAPKVAREDRAAFEEQRATLEAEYQALGEQRGQLRSALGTGGEAAMRDEAAAELAGGVDPETGKLKPAKDRDLFKAGDKLREASANTFGAPDLRDTTFWAKLSEGAGSVGAFASTALVPGGAVVKTAAGGIVGSESNAASLYTEALDAGADEETAQKAAAWGSLIGAGEIVPINRALKILPRSWGPAVSNKVMKGFVEIAESAGEEAAQEYLATVANNIVASGYYDPERGWDEGAGEAAIIGAILGGGLGAVGTLRGDPESARAPVRAPGEEPPAAPGPPPEPAPEDELAAAMGLPAPVAPPAAPVAPEAPPVAAKAPEKTTKPVEKIDTTPAEAEGFAVMDEVETIDGEERPTGRKVRVNLNTGDAEVIEDSETGAEVGGDGDGGRGAPGETQAAAAKAEPPPAEPSPAPAAAPTPTAPDPEFVGDRPPPVRKFLTHDETLAIQTDPKTFQYKGGADTEGVTDALRNIKTFDPNRAGQVVLFERKDGTVVVADGHQRTGLARRAAEGGQADVGGAAATVYREVDGYTAEEVMGLAALKNIGEGSGSAVDAARILRTRSESIADLGLPPNSALVRKAEGIRRLSDDAFGMVANGVATEEYGDVVGRNVPDKALQAEILAALTREKPDNLAQAAMIARDMAADTTTEEQTDMFGTLQVQKSLYVERAKVLDAAMKSQGILAKTFRNLVEREGVITSAGNQLDTKANAALVDEAGQVRQYLQSQANMKGAISDALTKAANAVRSGTSVARAADGFVKDVKSALQGAGPGSEAPPGGGAPDEGRAENQPDPVTPEPGADLFGAMLGTAPKAEPKPDPGADLFAAMGGTPPQKGKTPDQVRAEAEAKVKAAQSKAGTTIPQKEAGPLFDDQADIEKPAAPVDPISRGRDILKPFTKPGDEIYDPLSGPDLRDTDKGKALSEALGKAKTAAERETIADAYVLKEGKASGVEHLVVLAEDGSVLAMMSGSKSGVSLHAAVWRAIEAGKAAYATHNHPSSQGFSGADVGFLARGLKKLTAIGHNGRRHVATQIPGVMPKPEAFRLERGEEKHDFLRDKQIFDDIVGVVQVGINQATYELPSYKADPTKVPGEYTRAVALAPNLVMARMGLFRYEGATEAEVTAEGFNFEDIYGRSSSAFTDRLGRAGFVLAKGRDQDGNGTPEGGTETAQPTSDSADQRTALPDGPGDRAGRLPAPDPVAKADAFDKTASDVLDDIFGAKPVQKRTNQDPIKKRTDDDIAKDLGSLFNEDPAKFMSPMERAKAKAKARPTRQKDLFDMLNAARPGERQVDLEDYIDEKKAADRDLFGFGEDVISTAKYAQAVPLFREILAGQDVNAQPVVDTIRAVALRFKDNGLTRDGIERMLPYLKLYLADVRDGKLTNPVEDGDVSGADGNLEPDRGDATAGDGLGKAGLPASGRGPGGAGGRGRTAPGDGDGQRNPGDGVPDGDAASVGTEGDPALSGRIRAEPGAAVDRDGAGSRDRGEQRPAPDSQPAAHTERYAVEGTKSAVADRQAQQAEADRLTKAQGVKWADEANVRQSLPLLKPEQQDDVIKIEKRFAKPDGHGMLLTNGTGTGKTYSGGGQVKRFVQAGKTNILIVAPSQGILDHWENALADMGIPSSRLSSTTDSGKGVTLTTYANMGENETLADRDWDLVVTDEAHKLSQNAAGDSTSALETLRAITNRPADRQKASMMRRRAAWAKAAAMPDGDAKTEAYNRLWALARQDADEMATKPRAKVLFLSATPFAYVKNTDYAEGYLFDYPKDSTINGSRQPGRNLFMVENFGMRIRYHKLTQPDVGVDTGVFEREFHEKMKRDGVLSGRMLDIDADYDRVFVASESAEGVKIDEILQFLHDQANAKGDDQRTKEYRELIGSIKSSTFNYLRQMQLLEAIKADKATKDIETHLKLGRKVVVFHDYNVGGGFNPFRPVADMEKGIIPTAEAYAGYARLVAEKPEVEKLNFAGLLPPVEALKKRFGDRAVIYNGTIPQKVRKQAKADFQTDGSGIDVIIVQSAAGEAGIDLHDTTGGHQRALINLGMPVRPTTALQEEGRIRREGSITDAAFRYYTIGTAWERRAFAAKIAQRSGTVENLALGNQARTIRDSFIDAFTDATPIQPAQGDGKGGKVKDRAQASTSPYDTAKTHYYGRMKTTGKRDQREGLDFYPTPEPVAFKMVEWAGIRAYERALEPSAGDGAIARYLPEHARRTIIEPSMDLLSKAEMRAPGSTAVNRTFEDYHIANKHHAIIMNPPFGSGGKTAMDHLAKAMTHLKPGGRIVALVPTGPAADKRFDALWDSDASKGFNLRATVNLPAVAFEKAGTSVMSRVLIIDKTGDDRSYTGYMQRDLTGIDKIADLFDRLEDMTLPDRVEQRFDPTEEVDIEVDEDGNPVEQAIETAAPPARIGKPVADSMGGFKLAQTKHGKTGADLFVATAENRVDDDAYKMALAVAKSHGGWYSYFKGSGAIPGFQFKSEAQRQAFLDDMGKPTIGGMEEAAYHGTPHEFDRFSLDKIGTGEGAQTYGWGLYFAGRREVAEYYRNKLTVPQLMIEGDISPSFFFDNLSSKTIVQVEALLAEKPAAKPAEISAEDWRNAKSLLPITLFRTFNNLRDKVRNTLGEDPKKRLAIYRETALARYQANVADARVHDAMERASELAAIDWLADRASVQGSGSLFKVEVPDKQELMDWDATMAEQPPAVRAAMESVWFELFPHLEGLQGPAGGMTGYKFYREISTAGGPKAASEAMRRAGIPGHRFLDQGSRDGGEGTYNYVIYDEDKIQITGFEEDPAVFVSELKDELGLRDLSMFVTRSGDLKLNMIAVPRDQQGQGIGTKAMERIAEYADAGNLRIIASPGQRDDGFGTTSRNRLVRFYKRFGFVENRGRNKDFSINEGLYRPAKAPKLQSPRLPSVQSIIDEVDQKAAGLKVGEIKRALKAELERLDLKRVNLRFRNDVDWQGMFLREVDGSMFVIVGAAHDPMATLHHEVIHVLKEMNLFTEGEWAALEKAAEKWIAKYDIATRYPSLTRAEQLEEAIAEEFGESFAKKQAPRGSLLITAFNKIIRFFKAVRNAAQGLGFRTAEDIFGRALSGEISARQRAWDRAPEPNRHESTVKADAFKRWFGKSMVTDKAGKPLQVYHGTKFDQDINIFLPMTHFGTARAAGQRLNEKEDWSPAYKPDGERLYPVYVSMENPLQIGREQGFGQNGEWVDDSDMIRQIGKRLEREAEDITGERKAALTSAAERLAALSEDTYKERVTAIAARTQTAEILDELGYDGLTYTNIIEDSSNVSYVPLRGEQVKSPFNRGTFDPRDPRISYQKARLPSAQARAHMATQMGGQHLHIPDRRIWQELSRAGAPIWERLGNGAAAARDAVDRARVVIQDRMLPLRRAQFEIEKLRGSPLPSAMDPYTVETTFSGKVGRHLFEIDEDYTKPIVSLIARTNGRLTAESVGTWLYARHAIERNARIASINPRMPDGGSGMTDADAQAILAAAAASPDAAALDQIGVYIDLLRERSLTLRQSKGLITAAEANRWRTQYKHYVPLKGWADTDQSDMMLDVSGVGRRFNTRGQESRRALGRKSEAFNPLQAAITQAQEVAIRAEKNAVGQAAYELAKAYPSPALWSIKQVKMKQVFNRTTGLVELRPEDPVSMMMDPNEMAVKVSGQEHRIVFHDPRLARALGQVGADQMNGVMRVLSLMSRFFSMTRTMLNPEFMITNAFRDFQTAQFGIQAFGINPKTKQDDRVAIAAAMAANWRKAFGGVFRGMGNKTNTQWSKYYEEFQKAGAHISFWTLDQPESAVDDLNQRIDLARGKRAARMLKHLRPRAVFNMRDNPVLAFIERTNLAVDNAIRLAAFIKARELGWDVQDAAFLAKELTVNFNRRGETTSTVNALYPFFNAAIQGSVRVAKALTSRRVAMLALMSVGAGVVLDLVNAMLSDRDDDDELFYDKIPEYRNERNLHLVLWGTGDNPAAIPMPYGYNIFPYAGQQIGKVIRGVKKPDEAFGDVMVAAFGAFSPVNGGTAETTAAPFFADPFVELAQNENFAGNTIYPAFPKTGAPDSQVFYPSATLTSRYVAETLNAMTGGDFRQPGLIDVSPETMDHLAAYVGGSAAAFWGRNADIVGKVLSGKAEEIEQRDVPFVRILTSPITEWVDLDRYRQFSLDVRDANADAKAYTEAGQKVPPEVRARADLYEDYLAAERELKGQGDWNANKAGALTPRDDQAIWLSFNRKYLKVTRPKP